MGPITLFDKSFLQSISADEAVWFDRFFISIVSPIFYVETLGDLAKETTKRPAEAIVRDIANKFPEWSGSPCVFHGQLVANDLLGNAVLLRHQIPRPGGRAVQAGVVFDTTPEEEAFRRWQQGEFAQVERVAASLWRRELEQLDLVTVQKELRALGLDHRMCKSLQEAKSLADTLVKGTSRPYALLALAVQFFHIPDHLHPRINQAWQQSGAATFVEFAPYTAFALTVEIFFQIALGAGLIGGERPSNRTDIAYLFYLPFAMVFVSSDDLHRRVVPLFMREDQEFVWGADLKTALKAVNEHFLITIPEGDREKGLTSLVDHPPPGNLVSDLWDRFMRKGYREKQSAPMSPESQAALMQRMKGFTKQPTLAGVTPSTDKAEMVAIERQVRKRRGSWWVVPKDLSDMED